MTDQVVEDDRRRRFLITAPEGQGNFPVDFPVEIVKDKNGVDYVPLAVFADDVEITDWTWDETIKEVILDEDRPQGTVVVVEGRALIKRSTGYPLSGALRTSRLNGDMNAIIRMLQEMARDLSRAITLNKSEGSGISNFLDLLIPGRALVVNEDGSIGMSETPFSDLDEAVGDVTILVGQAEDARNLAQGYRDDAAGLRDEAEGFKDAAEAAAAQLPQNNYMATVAPTANDDSADGYSVGSRWAVVTGDKEIYTCLDASAGAAVWETSTLTIDDLGSAALAAVADFATAAQGVKADTALQPNGNGSGLTGITGRYIAKVNWNATAANNQTGTYNLVGGSGSIQIAVTGHGYKVGHVVCGSGSFGSNQVMLVTSVTDANNFVCATAAGASSSGAITLFRHTILSAVGVDSVVNSGTGTAWINLTNTQPDTNYICLVSATNTTNVIPLGGTLNRTVGTATGKGTRRIETQTSAFNTETNFAQTYAVFF